MSSSADSFGLGGLDAMPWSVAVTEHEECADALRAAGLRAVSLRRGWQDEVAGESAVLLVGRAQRIAGDLHKKFGVERCFGASVPLPYEFPSEFIASQRRLRQKSAGRDLEPHEVAGLWRELVEVGALPVEVAPTNHPDAKPQPKHIPFESVFAFGQRPRRPLVWGAGFPAGGFGVLFGAPESFKSFVAYGLACAIVDGEPFLGHKTAAGSVLVVAGEGQESIADRIRAATTCARVADPVDSLNKRLLVRGEMPNLVDPSGFDEFSRSIEAASPSPALLIVDTWARLAAACRIEVTKDNDGTMVIVEALKRLQRRFGLGVLVIAHTNLTTDERPMGAQALVGAAEFVFSAKRRTGFGRPSVRLDFDGGARKNKDRAKAAAIEADLASVVVGDFEGEPVTSLRLDTWRTVKEADEPKARGPKAKEAILLALQAAGHEGITLEDARKAASKAQSTTFEALERLEAAGMVKRDGGRWRLA